MKKLDKRTLRQRDVLQAIAQDAYDELYEAIDKFNTAQKQAWAKLQDKIDTFNEAVDDANAWAADVASEIQGYMDDRSDKWREGEKGQEYQNWLDQYDNTDWDRAGYEKPETLMYEFENVAELMGELPEEVSE